MPETIPIINLCFVASTCQRSTASFQHTFLLNTRWLPHNQVGLFPYGQLVALTIAGRANVRTETCKIIQDLTGRISTQHDLIRDHCCSALQAWPSQKPIYHTGQIAPLSDTAEYISKLAVEPTENMYRECIVGFIRTRERDLLTDMEGIEKEMLHAINKLHERLDENMDDADIKEKLKLIGLVMSSMVKLRSAMRRMMAMNNVEKAMLEDVERAEAQEDGQEQTGTFLQRCIRLALRKGKVQNVESAEVFLRSAQKWVLGYKYKVFADALGKELKPIEDIMTTDLYKSARWLRDDHVA